MLHCLYIIIKVVTATYETLLKPTKICQIWWLLHDQSEIWSAFNRNFAAAGHLFNDKAQGSPPLNADQPLINRENNKKLLQQCCNNNNNK